MVVGPESVGYELTTRALCFGGSVCTATDVAVAAGVASGMCSCVPLCVNFSFVAYSGLQSISKLLCCLDTKDCILCHA